MTRNVERRLTQHNSGLSKWSREVLGGNSFIPNYSLQVVRREPEKNILKKMRGANGSSAVAVCSPTFIYRSEVEIEGVHSNPLNHRGLCFSRILAKMSVPRNNPQLSLNNVHEMGYRWGTFL